MARLSTVRDLRRANRSALLRPLFLTTELTRPELSVETGLSQATVSNVIGELLAEGVVTEAGVVDSAGGRPRQLLRIDPTYGYVIGVDVGETCIRTEVFDLAMRALAATNTPLCDGPIVDDVVAGIATSVGQVITASGVTHEQVLGVGVGVPGLVEQRDEVLVHGQTIGWHAVPLAAMLRARIDLPLLVDNGAKTLGQAEMWFGAGRGVSDAVVALLGTGVGACIVTGGTTYRGATSSAGEWGHTVVHRGGRPCRCGGTGCLEAYVGAESLLDRYVHARRRPLPADTDIQAAVHDLITGNRHDKAATSALAETIEYVGVGVGNLINLFNPELIVLGGWVGLLLGRHHLPAIEQAAARYALHRAFAQTTITTAQLGVDAVAMGAATLPVERLLATGATRQAPSRRQVAEAR
jgi:predicted NBD/HSP70 family sugar kinase